MDYTHNKAYRKIIEGNKKPTIIYIAMELKSGLLLDGFTSRKEAEIYLDNISKTPLYDPKKKYGINVVDVWLNGHDGDMI